MNVASANWVDKHTVDVIEPIALRAPEVILGAEWGPSAEIWGLGCVVSPLWNWCIELWFIMPSSIIFYQEAG
jgi:hypothetical protein